MIEEGIPDGMKVDERGNVWVTGPRGVWVISPEGEHLGVIEVPENVGNIAWGGSDWKMLYIPSSTSVYRVPTKVASAHLPTTEESPSMSTALIIQDMQNDVIGEQGAFAETGAPAHAASQNVVANVARLADAARAAGVPVIHVHYIVEEGSAGLRPNAPLFQGVVDTNALVRGSWGAAAVEGVEPVSPATTSSRRCG